MWVQLFFCFVVLFFDQNFMLFVTEPGSLELMIQKQQKTRQDQMNSYLDELAAKYTTKKPRTPKRKAPPGGPAAKTSKK